MTTVAYEFDVIAWAQEQAALLRSGRFDLLDIEHIADEIEDVGKSEKRELKSRMAILLTHLLKWQYQPSFRGNSWQRTINVQRKDILSCIRDIPSLKPEFRNPDWWESVWADSLYQATKETGFKYEVFPECCPWSFDQIMDMDFWPSHE
ncbi:MAG: DUF29 domain-containing protein [Methylococcaceae bacterium]|nr:MAG: DUF29 domain-containing protein [Methylococcaceae bacterium]